MPAADFISDFTAELHREHLEEASFFYEYRRTYLANPAQNWRGIRSFEERLERHIHALCLDGDSALGVCAERAVEGDFGELYTAIRVFSRRGRVEPLLEALLQRTNKDSGSALAATDGLCHERPGPWMKDVMKALVEQSGALTTMACTLAGSHRLPVQRWLQREFDSPEELAAAQWALGRMRVREAEGLLLRRLQHPEPRVRTTAAQALVALGSGQAVDRCLAAAAQETWPLVALGVGGGQRAAQRLLSLSAQEPPSREGILALGLLGDPAAVEPLLTQLEEGHHSRRAAIALWLITGADLVEQVAASQAVQEEERFEEVVDGPKGGDPDDNAPPTSTNGTVVRLASSPESWRAWWQEHRARFKPDLRYRTGVAYSPAPLLAMLGSSTCPRPLRQLAYEELVVRYGLELPFGTGSMVAHQERFLERCTAWLQENATRYRPGTWYFAGVEA